MAKQAPEDLLSKARDKLHDENIITLLGEPDAGKTVVSALFKHALFNKFIPLHGGGFEALVSKGGEEVDEILRGMQADHVFPPATKRVDAPQVELAVYKMKGEGAGKMRLVLQDSSGETYMDMLRKEFDDPNKRLEEILAYNNEKSDVGSLAPYVFSKVYLLVIECPVDSSHWDTLHSSGTITALHEIHAAAKLTHNKKIQTHIAILFTKSDMLDDGDRHKPPTELLRRMPQLESALKLLHGGELECFKLSIDVEPETPQDRDQRVQRLLQRANKNLELDLKDFEQRMYKFVEQTDARVRKELENEYSSDIEERVKEARSNAEKKFLSLHPKPVRRFDAGKENATKHKLKGFNYSQDEYVRLIGWIIDRLCD